MSIWPLVMSTSRTLHVGHTGMNPLSSAPAADWIWSWMVLEIVSSMPSASTTMSLTIA